MDEAREHAIRERAYQLWESEGRPQGREEEYWRRAEQELAGGEGEAAGEPDKAGEHDPQSMGSILP